MFFLWTEIVSRWIEKSNHNTQKQWQGIIQLFKLKKLAPEKNFLPPQKKFA
jgi:hypothetical protein